MKQMRASHIQVAEHMVEITQFHYNFLYKHGYLNIHELEALNTGLLDALRVRDYDTIINFYNQTLDLQVKLRNFLAKF